MPEQPSLDVSDLDIRVSGTPQVSAKDIPKEQLIARVVPFTDGMHLGLWFNRLTGEVPPSSAVQGTAISAL